MKIVVWTSFLSACNAWDVDHDECGLLLVQQSMSKMFHNSDNRTGDLTDGMLLVQRSTSKSAIGIVSLGDNDDNRTNAPTGGLLLGERSTAKRADGAAQGNNDDNHTNPLTEIESFHEIESFLAVEGKDLSVNAGNVAPLLPRILTVLCIFGLSALVASGFVWPIGLVGLRGPEREKHRAIKPAVLWARFVTLVTSFAEGYGFYVASTGMLVIASKLDLSSMQVTAFQSVMYLVMPAGLLLTGPLADALGRVTMLTLSNATVVAGATCMALNGGFHQLMLGRILEALGLGMGITSIMIYSSEISPKDVRGHFSGLEEALNVLGMLVGAVANRALLGVIYDWRWGLAFAALAPGLMLVLIALGFVPESPRWLKLQGRHEAAEQSLRLLLTEPEAEEVLADWAADCADATTKSTTSLWADVLMPACFEDRRSLVAALVVQGCQMICGISALMTYMPAMLSEYGSSAAVLQATALILVARVAVVFLSTSYFIDSWGRRPLLLVSLLGTLLGSGLLAASCWLPRRTIFFGKVLSFLVFVISYASGLGPVPWAYVGEVVQTRLRSKAVAIILAITRLAAGMFIFGAGLGRARIGDSVCFLFLVLSNTLGLLLTWSLVVETKGVSLEHTLDLFNDKATPG